MDGSQGADDAGQEVPEHQAATPVRGPEEEGLQQEQGCPDLERLGEEDEESSQGIVMLYEDLDELLHRAAGGEDPDLLMVEIYANTEPGAILLTDDDDSNEDTT